MFILITKNVLLSPKTVNFEPTSPNRTSVYTFNDEPACLCVKIYSHFCPAPLVTNCVRKPVPAVMRLVMQPLSILAVKYL